MDDVLVRRRAITLAALAAAVVLVGCGEDKRLKELNTGITRDSAVKVIGQNAGGTASDSLRNVFITERFLTNGQNFEVLYFTPNNKKAGKDTVPYKKLTPVVFVENKLVAKGWNAWDSIAGAHKIPVPSHK
jgi:hypothetical protein